MKITPLDIRRREFKRSVRGYADEEVDIFLDEIADEFERLFQENMELQDKLHRIEEQSAGLTQMREALEKTLITAQVQSEEMRTNAHKESELILRDAELKARGIVNDSYGETQKVQQTLVQLKLLEEDFRFKFRSLLEGYLKLLGDAPIAAQAAEAAALAGSDDTAEVLAPKLVPVDKPAPTAESPGAATETRASAEPVPDLQARQQSPAAADAPKVVTDTPPVPVPDDEVPTEENESVAARVSAAVDAFAAAESSNATPVPLDQESTVESPLPTAKTTPEERPEVETMSQGFFFGRQTDDLDDTFPTEDALKNDRTREFQW